MSVQAALVFLPLVLPICFWVAWSDVAAMRIPNRAVLALMAVFAVVGPFVIPLPEYGMRWIHFGVVLAIGFVLNVGRLIGAGDAKFAAAMAPFVDRGDASAFLFGTAFLLLIAFAGHRGVRRVPPLYSRVSHWESWTRSDFPVGLALGAALPLYLIAHIL